MKGNRTEKFLTATGSDGTEYRMPVGIITGAKDGPQVTIYGGHHGTEYAGIEAVLKLYRTLDPGEVAGRIVFGLVSNEQAFRNWEQFAKAPKEIMDMKRELAEGSQYLIDCHGGEITEGMCPYVICRLLGVEELDEQARAMARAFGTPFVSYSQYRGEPPLDPSGGRPPWWLWPSKNVGDELQIPSITPEVGQQGSRDEDGAMYNGLVNVLKQVGVIPGSPSPAADVQKAIGDRYWITATGEGVSFPEVGICQDVAKGELMGRVRDYFGNTIQEVIAPADAKVMNMNKGMPVKENGFLFWIGEIEP
jgi:predicted deacylase